MKYYYASTNICAKKSELIDDFNKFATEILELVGGEEYVKAITHCMTRLRLNLKDEDKVNKEKLERVPGVL